MRLLPNFLLVMLMVSGCVVVPVGVPNLSPEPFAKETKRFEVGTTRREEIIEALGEPTHKNFDESEWIYGEADWTFAWALFAAGYGGQFLAEGDVYESDYCLNLRFDQSGKLSYFRIDQQKAGTGCVPNFVDLPPIAELFSVAPESIEHMSLALATRPGYVNLRCRCPPEDRSGVLVIGRDFLAFATWQSGQYSKDWNVKLEQIDQAMFDCTDACCHVTLKASTWRFRKSRTFKLKMVEKDDVWSGDVSALNSALSVLQQKIEILR